MLSLELAAAYAAAVAAAEATSTAAANSTLTNNSVAVAIGGAFHNRRRCCLTDAVAVADKNRDHRRLLLLNMITVYLSFAAAVAEISLN